MIWPEPVENVPSLILPSSIGNDPGVPGFVTGVTSQGAVNGLVGGQVTLTASTGGVFGKTDVVVTEATPLFLGVTPTNGTVQLGQTQQFTVTATFSDSTTEVVTPYVRWTTFNPGVAAIYPGGLAYPSGAGVANVTANIGGAAGAAALTVQ